MYHCITVAWIVAVVPSNGQNGVADGRVFACPSCVVCVCLLPPSADAPQQQLSDDGKGDVPTKQAPSHVRVLSFAASVLSPSRSQLLTFIATLGLLMVWLFFSMPRLNAIRVAAPRVTNCAAIGAAGPLAKHVDE